MYSELTYSIDRKVAGNGSAGLGHGYLDENFYAKNPWYEDLFIKHVNGSKDGWKVWSQMKDFCKDLIEVKMNTKAQHSDFIDFAGFLGGFIVNDRLRNILEKVNLPKHKFYSVTFDQDNITVNGYWWFVYDLEIGADTVDFSKSSFVIREYESNFIKLPVINSYDHYLDLFYKKGIEFKANKLVFNSNFDTELDIWGPQFLTRKKAYISQKLLEKFGSERITGFRVVEPVCNLVFPHNLSKTKKY